MKGKFFLDTNIFVYSFGKQNASKQGKAVELINAALKEFKGIISAQVVQEFLNVALKKFASPLKVSDCRIYLDNVLEPICEVFPIPDLYKEALGIYEETGYSFYDSLIIAASIKGNCNILYSEDLQDNHLIRGIRIVNPFK